MLIITNAVNRLLEVLCANSFIASIFAFSFVLMPDTTYRCVRFQQERIAQKKSRFF